VLHATYIFLIRSPEWYLVSSVDHYAPHYVIFSTLCYLVPLTPKRPPQHPILKYSTMVPQCERPSFSPIHNRQNCSSILFFEFVRYITFFSSLNNCITGRMLVYLSKHVAVVMCVVVFDHCECCLLRQIGNHLEVSERIKLMLTLLRLRVMRIMFEVTVRTAQSTHSVWVTKTSQLMLYREIIAVCSEIHTKQINTLCGQNGELLSVKLVVHIVTTEL
jgi:hypothetical protein